MTRAAAKKSGDGTTGRPRGRPVDVALADRRRDEIMCVAAKLFARKGFAEAETQEVADALKVGKGTVYRYFPSKEALFHAVVDRVMRDLGVAIDRAMERVQDPLAQLEGAIRAYLQFFHDHPHCAELLIIERAHFRDRKKPTYYAYRDANKSRWQRFFQNLVDQGLVRPVPLDRVSEMIGDFIYGTMFTNHVAGRSLSLVEQGDDIIDLIFGGLLTGAERTRRAATPRGAKS